MAATIYQKPVDSKIFGTVELDVTDLEDFVLAKRREGLKITLMHPLILMVARALQEEVPELNCYIRRGRVVPRKQVDAVVSVLLGEGNQMGGVLVPDAGSMSLSKISAFLLKQVPDARKGHENKTMGLKTLLAALPWPFRGWLVAFFKWLTINMGWSIPALGVSPDSFGSFVFSNIGSIGLDVGYAALMPVSNVSIVITMGSVNTRPVVLDEKIVPRRILSLSAVLDHRVVDASHAGQLFRYLKRKVKRGEDFL